MNELFQKIDEIAPEGRSNRHSFFQLQYFVVGKEPTIQSRLQTCKNELLSRKDEIESFITMLEEAYDQYRAEEMGIEEIKAGRHQDQLSEIEQLRIRHIRRKMKSLDAQVRDFKNKKRDKEDEANFLIGLFEKLCEIEAPKDWDSLDVQSEYWNARLTQEVETSLLLGKTPENDVLKCVLALPPGMPIKETTQQLMKRGEQLYVEQQEKLLADVDKSKGNS